MHQQTFRTRLGAMGLTIALSVCAIAAWAQHAAKATESAGASQSRVARGKYIVESVAMCGTCHTPRLNNGDMDREHWLDGAALWVQPSRPDSNWPLKAPRLAGTPPGSDAELVTLLTTGIWQDGSRLRPPMPQFRMSKDDAEAVVAYLRSLTPGPGD